MREGLTLTCQIQAAARMFTAPSNPLHVPKNTGFLLSLLDERGNWGLKRLSKVPKTTELAPELRFRL